MLFLRCEGGISHNPAENVDELDVAIALDVMERALIDLGARP
jgi:allantoate deiminase